jgi:hypothetical protein
MGIEILKPTKSKRKVRKTYWEKVKERQEEKKLAKAPRKRSI